MVERVRIVPFSKGYSRNEFSCGEESLDTWLQNYSSQSEHNNVTRTFFLVDEFHDSMRIHGYNSLLNSQVLPDDAALALNKSNYRYPMPATLLARLAVRSGTQGKGFGRMLLAHAINQTVESMRFSASQILIADALHERAAAFYEKHGFRRFRDHELKLFILTRDLVASLDAAGE